MLRLARQKEENAGSKERLDKRRARFLAQFVDHARDEGGAFLVAIMLVDQDRRPAPPNLLDLVPENVLGRDRSISATRGAEFAWSKACSSF